MKKIIFVLSVCIFISTNANAALINFTDRSTFAGTDFIDWAQLGAPFTNPADGSLVTSNLGTTATVTDLSGGLERRDQGSGWGGNFANGDALLWTDNSPGPLSIDFTGLVGGVGAQIQQDSFGGFTGIISVFNSLDAILGSFNLAGTSNGNGDNSAIFIGIKSDALDIARVEFDISGNGDFAINQVALSDSANQVPEPATLVLMGLGLAGIGFRRKKKA